MQRLRKNRVRAQIENSWMSRPSQFNGFNVINSPVNLRNILICGLFAKFGSVLDQLRFHLAACNIELPFEPRMKILPNHRLRILMRDIDVRENQIYGNNTGFLALTTFKKLENILEHKIDKKLNRKFSNCTQLKVNINRLKRISKWNGIQSIKSIKSFSILIPFEFYSHHRCIWN